MSFENDLIRRKKRWEKFQNGSEEVKKIKMIEFNEGLEEKPFIKDGRYDYLSDWIVKKYDIMCENTNWLKDDTVPYLDMLTGTEIFAESFGCGVVYPEDNNPFALHMISSCSEISKVKVPNIWDTRINDIFEMTARLREKTDNNATIRMPDIQSPADIAALILRKDAFFIGMMEEPEAIKELIAKAMELLVQFLDAWFKEFGSSFVAHFPDYYMDYGLTLSEDEIGVISTEMFEEFFLENLNRLSGRYGKIGIHCCADSRHQWDNFKKIDNLCLLNLVRPEPVIAQAYSFFEDKCNQMHSFYSDGPVSSWGSRMPEGARVVYKLQAKDHSDALYKLEQMDKI